MSLTKAITIWCDAEWCFKWENYNEAKAKDTRKLAKSDGWVSTKRGDFCCPSHAKGKRTKEEKQRAKYQKRQAKQDAEHIHVRSYGEDMSSDDRGSIGTGGVGSTSTISALVIPEHLTDPLF